MLFFFYVEPFVFNTIETKVFEVILSGESHGQMSEVLVSAFPHVSLLY